MEIELSPFLTISEEGKFISWYECDTLYCLNRVRYYVSVDSEGKPPQRIEEHCERCHRPTIWNLIPDPRKYGS